MQRPVLAQLLEMEDRLGADSDVDPVRERIANALSAILGLTRRPDQRGIVQDVMSLVAALVNAAAGRGERDGVRLVARIEAVVQARLRSA